MTSSDVSSTSLPSEAFALMAAAQMHKEGRLVEPDSVNVPIHGPNPQPEARTNEPEFNEQNDTYFEGKSREAYTDRIIKRENAEVKLR